MASLSLKLLQAANKLFSAENRHVGHKLTNSLWSCYMTAKIKSLRKPVDSIREAVFTVSPNKQ